MIFKTPFSFKADRGDQTSAGVIVFLMMALVFVPIMAAHVAMAWGGAAGPQQLAALVNAILLAF